MFYSVFYNLCWQCNFACLAWFNTVIGGRFDFQGIFFFFLTDLMPCHFIRLLFAFTRSAGISSLGVILLCHYHRNGSWISAVLHIWIQYWNVLFCVYFVCNFEICCGKQSGHNYLNVCQNMWLETYKWILKNFTCTGWKVISMWGIVWKSQYVALPRLYQCYYCVFLFSECSEENALCSVLAMPHTACVILITKQINLMFWYYSIIVCSSVT